MLHRNGERQLHAFLRATRRAIDPGRSLLLASTPYIVGASIGPAKRQHVIAATLASHRADADYIHLEFARGQEQAGPVNIVSGMFRSKVCHIREHCRFWLGEDGTLALIAICGPKTATMTFDPEGMDSRPGRPEGSMEPGYERASIRLRDLADQALAAIEFDALRAVAVAA